MDEVFVHYGHKRFEKKRFVPIMNRQWFMKPIGGLWASPVNCERGWKDWCEANEFHTDNLKKSFMFKLKDGANVLRLTTPEDLEELPKQKEDPTLPVPWVVLDFEELVRQGVDAIWLEISNLYWTMYGWDCDTLLVMNPDVVQVM